MSLVLVQRDGEYTTMRRVGRFSCTIAERESAHHFAALLKEMQEQMIAGLAKQGYEYLGLDFEVRGPLSHIEFSDSVDADPGPTAAPDPRDTAAHEAWERAEKARVARKLGQATDLEDWQLVTAFKRRLPRQFSAVRSTVWQPQRST